MSSRTSALWIQYMNMLDILSKYITAECTRNQALYLQDIQEMLPYLSASGQMMHNLKAEHPKVQKRFEVGFPVIQRIDRLWLGLSPDLIIEQVLLRSLKTSGGLTGGEGWLSMRACAEVNQAM